MRVGIKISKSKTAAEFLRRDLTKAELVVLNYLALMAHRKNSVKAKDLDDWVRGKQTYKSILNNFENRGIIVWKSNFIFDPENPKNNRCRRYALYTPIQKEILAAKTTASFKKTVKVEDIFEDHSQIIDKDTKETLEALNKLTIDNFAVEHSEINVLGYLILKKFINAIRNVRKSPNTGRISHILLNAGSREVRKFFRYNSKKPLEFDGKCFHFQLIQKYLTKRDSANLHHWLTNDFYTQIMKGTGLTDRDEVKKKCQQVLTQKRLGKVANKIRAFLFLNFPSLELFCKSVWAEGGTVQRFLQAAESEFINGVCRYMRKKGYWILSFYDGVWIERDNKAALTDLALAVSSYIFEEKI